MGSEAEMTEECMSELEDRAIEMIQYEQERTKRF